MPNYTLIENDLNYVILLNKNLVIAKHALIFKNKNVHNNIISQTVILTFIGIQTVLYTLSELF